ncbi:MAG: phage tail protein, partial [Thermoleophilia bacterium]|nr:phage tail protein [Thermoleophilia bacterium]
MASAPLADTVAAILADYGFTRFDAGTLAGTVTGYAIDRIMSPREALRAFELAYFIDTVESDGALCFRQRGAAPSAVTAGTDALVETRPQAAPLDITRGQETELPAAAKVRYLSAGADYRQAVAESRRLSGASSRVSEASVAIVMDAAQAAAIADSWLFEAWASRERFTFALPPSMLALEPGDIVTLETAAGPRTVRVISVGDAGVRQIEALGIDTGVYAATPAPARPGVVADPVTAGQPAVLFLDLPLLRGDESPSAGYAAAVQVPWPGGVAIYSSPEDTGYRLRAIASRPATVGTLATALDPGPPARWDRATVLDVTLASGTLASASTVQVLGGANAAAVQSPSGGWEVIQFASATLIAPSTY